MLSALQIATQGFAPAGTALLKTAQGLLDFRVTAGPDVPNIITGAGGGEQWTRPGGLRRMRHREMQRAQDEELIMVIATMLATGTLQ